jgi:hypothetical protein
MRRFVIVGALALTVAAIFHQQALAWKNVHFSIGLNYSCQSGGNNLLWGVFRNGQPGAPDWECHHSSGYNFPTFGGYSMIPDMSHAYAGPAAAPAVPQSHAAGWYNPGYQTVNFAPYEYGYSYIFP